MATTDNNVKYDCVFFDEFFHKLELGFTRGEVIAVKKLVEIGLLQRDRLVEIAISKVTGVAMDSTYGQDFADGADAKSVVLSMRNNDKKKGTWTASFPVVKVKGKNGDILIVAYNKILEKFHYFRIPFSQYQHITHVLEIIVERYNNTFSEPKWTGVPNVNCKWWKYEVESFDRLCKIAKAD
jgi:hypothetical protein